MSIPQIHIAHTIELLFPLENPFVVGKSIPVSISIKSYQNWAPLNDTTITTETKFMYDIVTSEAWAISGKKKAYFGISEEGESISLSLVPLKTGKLALPHIDIQVQGANRELITMEVNYRNQYQSALIVPEFDRLTLSF